MFFRKFVTAVTLSVLFFVSLGCPVSSTFQEDFGEIYFDFTYDLKGLCLFWFRDVVILNPQIIIIQIPHLTSFTFPVGNIGWFGINNNLAGQNEFLFPVVANGSFAFIDFGEDGSFNGDDIRIDWNEQDSSFEILDHPFAGLGVAPGFYYLQFNPGLLNIPPVVEEPCWDINISMSLDDLTVQRNKVLCMNACILPHLAEGVGAGLDIETGTIVYNTNPFPVNVLMTFFNQDGTLADVTIDGTTSSSHSLTLAARSSRRLLPSLGGGVRVVWGIVFGDAPIDCALDFVTLSEAANGVASDKSVLQNEEFSGEAGISSGEPNTLHVLNVVKRTAADPELGVNTALAIANPTNSSAEITLTLLDENDVQVAENPLPGGPLGPKNQVAIFLDALFPDFDFPDAFEGTVILSSAGTDTVVMSLQTNASGVQQASLPSANRQVP